MLHARRTTVHLALATALALTQAGCDRDDFLGCWAELQSAIAVGGAMSIGLRITDEDGDALTYEVHGNWAHTDDPDWQGTDQSTWPHVGLWTGVAVRTGDRITISGELTDCEGEPVGTIQAEDLRVEPAQFVPGGANIPKSLRGDLGDLDLFVQTAEFTYQDSFGANFSGNCGGGGFIWFCRNQ